MNQINYDKLRHNVDEMINLLEYDGMRSPGKTKMNAETLVNLHKLKEIYKVADKQKHTPTKKEG